jgi:hypothetical protein
MDPKTAPAAEDLVSPDAFIEEKLFVSRPWASLIIDVRGRKI